MIRQYCENSSERSVRLLGGLRKRDVKLYLAIRNLKVESIIADWATIKIIQIQILT